MELLNKIWLGIRKVTDEWFDEDDWVIKPYYGYSNKQKIVLRGRVLKQNSVINLDDDTVWDNIVNNIRAFTTHELDRAILEVEYKGATHETVTDSEGYFFCEIATPPHLIHDETIDSDFATLKLKGHTTQNGLPIKAEAHFITLSRQTEFGIISDMDDTILKTSVNSLLKLKMIYNTLFMNSKSRLPFEGIAEVLQNLSKNTQNQLVNPLFYLSNSPWNLYEMLHQFLRLNLIPDGPLFLRDFGLHRGDELSKFNNHKADRLAHLLHFYEFPFILIGDATEGDTEIYLEVYRQHPDRIKAIFIRAAKDQENNDRIRNYIKEHPAIPLVLFSESEEILTYSKRNNIIE